MEQENEKRIPGCLCQWEVGDSSCPIHDDTRGHDWVYRDALTFCRNCNIIRRTDGLNKPCKGKIKISLRGSK